MASHSDLLEKKGLACLKKKGTEKKEKESLVLTIRPPHIHGDDGVTNEPSWR
jgi:hypothetical protein